MSEVSFSHDSIPLSTNMTSDFMLHSSSSPPKCLHSFCLHLDFQYFWNIVTYFDDTYWCCFHMFQTYQAQILCQILFCTYLASPEPQPPPQFLLFLKRNYFYNIVVVFKRTELPECICRRQFSFYSHPAPRELLQGPGKCKTRSDATFVLWRFKLYENDTSIITSLWGGKYEGRGLKFLVGTPLTNVYNMLKN